MKPLTEKQKEVYEYVKKFIRDNGYPPTATDVMNEFSFGSPNAAYCHLDLIAKKGYIKRTPNVARSIVVLGK